MAIRETAIALISSISADGRYVAFKSFASNLVPGDTNGTQTCSWLDQALLPRYPLLRTTLRSRR